MTTIQYFRISSEVKEEGGEEYNEHHVIDSDGSMLATFYDDLPLAEKFLRFIERENSGNALMTLRPYKWGSMWVFDDAAVGLRKEPFVSGVPEIINDLLFEQNIDGDDGFYLTFSATPFPRHQRELVWIEEENGGNWYETEDSFGNLLEGWLCPALFKYYDEAPSRLYAEVKPRNEGDKIKPDEEEPAAVKNFFQGLSNLSDFFLKGGVIK